MREYVDGIQGDGSWDRMHDLIEQKSIFGWAMPELDVDGIKVAIFPGSDRECTVEQVKNEIRKVHNQAPKAEERVNAE